MCRILIKGYHLFTKSLFLTPKSRERCIKLDMVFGFDIARKVKHSLLLLIFSDILNTQVTKILFRKINAQT